MERLSQQQHKKLIRRPVKMAQKIDPQDILIIRNIDVGCNDITSEVVKIKRVEIDEETGRRVTKEEDSIDEWSHADFFQVRYSNQPHRINPGETRRMPRYIAEHYAKHLANHMLQKMEKETGRTNLVQSSVERPKMLKQIIIGVDEYFLQGEYVDEGERMVQEVEDLNRGEKVIDLGEVENPMIGKLHPEEPVIDDVIGKVKASEKSTEKTEGKPLPPRSELMKECKELGIKFDIKNTSEELAAKIREF
jgi:hypothetical protein